MKNDVLSHQGKFQGIYQISDPINGKQSWTSGSTAIWYWQGYWLIGSLDNIGTAVCEISANGYDGGLDDSLLDDDNNEWQYWIPGNGWMFASPNDVSIDCTSKN